MAENFDVSFYLPVSSGSNSNLEEQTPVERSENPPKASLGPSHENLISNDESMAITETVEYKPLDYHWFYTDNLLGKLVWLPMSFKDSNRLEIEYKKSM